MLLFFWRFRVKKIELILSLCYPKKDMKAAVQRVTKAAVSVEENLISQIGKGLVVFFCAEQKDEIAKVSFLAKKIAHLRVFSDKEGKMNLSVKDVGGEILAISQFTLCADVTQGNRPSFTTALNFSLANTFYEAFCTELKKFNIPVKKGVFGADMKITQVNDGPVTIWYDI